MPVKKVGDKWEVNGEEYATEAAAEAAYKAIIALKFDVPEKKEKKPKKATKKKSKPKKKEDEESEE